MRGILVRAVLLLALAPGARAATVNVNVGGAGNGFSPQTITITVGDKVNFINKGGYHNAVADDGSFRCARGCDGDGSGGNGNASSTNWIASVRFTQAGRVGYFCEPHGMPGGGMYGTIIVRAALAPPVPAPGLGARLALILAGALALSALLRLRRN